MANPALHEVIKTRLKEAFTPEYIEVIDESHLHAGHAGAPEGGESHFKIRISLAPFETYTRVYRHQQVYDVLDDLMKTRIHALSIDFVNDKEC